MQKGDQLLSDSRYQKIKPFRMNHLRILWIQDYIIASYYSKSSCFIAKYFSSLCNAVCSYEKEEVGTSKHSNINNQINEHKTKSKGGSPSRTTAAHKHKQNTT